MEHALAAQATRRADTLLVVFDQHVGAYRVLLPAWQDALIGWSAVLETSERAPRRGWRAFVPSRQPAVQALERWRLTASAPWSALADAAQRALLSARAHNTPLWDSAGVRIDRIASDLALGEVVNMGPTDVLFSAGSGWAHGDASALAAERQRAGFRHAALCYDLIPITHPQFWYPAVARVVRDYWLTTLASTDLVVVNAASIADDVRQFARLNGMAPPPTVVLPLGFDQPRAQSAPLPAGLEAERYVLFVSTVEPRKGHSTLLGAWRMLLARGVPQRHRFTLVFVGRIGWMVDDVLALLGEDWLGSVRHLTHVDGAALEALYAGAAFCVYPSIYEGFGLPVIEAFARGKAVLAASGGALSETVAGLSPCLPPNNPAVWAAALEDWITEPAGRAPWEALIARDFAHPTWAYSSVRHPRCGRAMRVNYTGRGQAAARDAVESEVLGWGG